MGTVNTNTDTNLFLGISYFPDGTVVPDLMTIDEVIIFLRIPEVSDAKDFHNAVKNLIRIRNLPHILISKKMLFPRQKIIEWINNQTFRN